MIQQVMETSDSNPIFQLQFHVNAGARSVGEHAGPAAGTAHQTGKTVLFRGFRRETRLHFSCLIIARTQRDQRRKSESPASHFWRKHLPAEPKTHKEPGGRQRASWPLGRSGGTQLGLPVRLHKAPLSSPAGRPIGGKGTAVTVSFQRRTQR